MGAGTLTVRIGGFDLGIRWNHPELEDDIRTLFAAHVIADDPDIPANLSFKLPDPDGDDSVTGKIAVMMANRTMVLTVSAERALRAGVQLLDAEIRSGLSEPLVQAVPLVSDKGMVLLDAHMNGRLRRLEPKLARAGFHVVDVKGVLVDPDTLAVTIPSPSFDYDGSVLDGLAESSRRDRAGGAVPTRELDVTRWVLFRQRYLADTDSAAHNLTSTIPILGSRDGATPAPLLAAMGHRLATDEVRWANGSIDDDDLFDAIVNDGAWEQKPAPEQPQQMVTEAGLSEDTPKIRVEPHPDDPTKMVIHVGEESDEDS